MANDTTEGAMMRRLESVPELWQWALDLELIRGGDGMVPRFTHKGRVWFRWLEKQLPLSAKAASE